MIAVLGSLVLMVAGVGIHDSIIQANGDIFQKQYRYSHVLRIKPLGYEKIKEKFKERKIQFFEMRPSVLHGEKQDKNMAATILGEGNFVRLEGLDGQELFPKRDEAIISRKLAEDMKIQVGDVISYQFLKETEQRKLKITAITSAKMPQGIFLSQDTVEDFDPRQAYIGDAEALKLAEKDPNICKITPLTKQQENIDEMLESVNSVVTILILASFLLSFVILYNLGMVNYVERSRQYASMKVLGFYEKELRNFILKDSLLTIVPGYLLGVPASLRFLKTYVSIVAFDTVEWTPYISVFHFVLISGTVIIFSLAINLLIVRKVRRINMTEALKTVD